jgi:hypothetical protein
LSKLNWLVWVVANGLAAVLLSISPVFLLTNIKRTDELLGTSGLAPAILPLASLVFVIGSFLLPWLGLRRIVKQLTLGKWLLVSLGYLFVVSALVFVSLKIESARQLIDFGIPKSFFKPAVPSQGLFSKPWHHVIIPELIFAAFCWFGLAIFGWKTTASKSRTFVFWGSFAVAEVIARALEVAYRTTTSMARSFAEHGLDSIGMREMQYLLIMFSAAAAGSIASGAGIAYFVRQDNKTRWSMVISNWILGALVVATFAFMPVISQPYNVRILFTLLQKSLSPAPKIDQSSGVTVLTFDHKIPFVGFRFPFPWYLQNALSPDGKHLLVLDKEQKLVLVSVPSGSIKTLGSTIVPQGNVRFSWAQNSKHVFAIHEANATTSHRVRLFDITTGQAVMDRTVEKTNCDGGTLRMSTPVESVDQDGFWLDCASEQGDSYATKFHNDPNIPNTVLPHGDSEKKLRSFGIYKTTVGPVIVLRNEKYVPMNARILEKPSQQISLALLSDSTAAGQLTFQGVEAIASGLVFRYCGATTEVPNPPEQATETAWGPSFCRSIVVSMTTGAIVSQADLPETRVNTNVIRKALIHDKLEIISESRANSKKGRLIVKRTGDDTEIQSIVSIIQNPVAVTPDGLWLITYANEHSQLRFYRINQSAHHDPPSLPR